MTRLQKKCLFAAAGTHLLVVVVVLCSGWIKPASQQDTTPVLTIIPDIASDNPSSGVKSAQLPPPPPPVKPVDPTPPPPIPQPEKIVEPVKLPDPVKTPEKPQPEEVKPVDTPEINIPKPKPKPKHQVVAEMAPAKLDPKKIVDDTKAAQAAEAARAKAEVRQREQQRKAFQTAMNRIKENTSDTTEINLPGNSSASYANYGAIVVGMYHQAWSPPDNMRTAVAVVKFTVTIGRDGAVLSSRIIDPSGESSVDRAVQRMLDRVTFIRPFPEDSKDKQRTYDIDFNASRTSML